MSEERQWSGKTDGASWMHRALVGMLRVMPIPLVYLIVALVVPFYLLINREGTRSIYRYLRHRQGWGRVRSAFGCYGNHFLFGAALIDRFAAYAGRHFQTEKPTYHLFTDLAASSDGFIMLSSHIGNPELSGYMLCSDKKRMNAIIFPGEKASIHTWRDRMLSANNIRLIPADADMGWLFTLNAALADGEIVSIHADRTFGSPRTLEVNFLGAPAQIPQGPFSVAAMRNLPVLAGFSLKNGLKRYYIQLYRIDTPEMAAMSRDARMQALADRYAQVAGEVLRKWPLQWFNFFDFWNEQA